MKQKVENCRLFILTWLFLVNVASAMNFEYIDLLTKKKPTITTCSVCKKSFNNTDINYCCDHPDHPLCLYKKLKEDFYIPCLIGLLQFKQSSKLFFVCNTCDEVVQLKIKKSIQLYYDCISAIEKLETDAQITLLLELPNYLAQKVLEKMDKESRKNYFKQLTNKNKIRFLVKNKSQNWDFYIGSLGKKEQTEIVNKFTPEILSMKKIEQINDSEICGLEKKTIKSILINFWPEIPPKKRDLMLKKIGARSPRFFSRIIQNNGLSKTDFLGKLLVTINITKPLLEQMAENLSSGSLRNIFTQILTSGDPCNNFGHLFEYCQKKLYLEDQLALIKIFVEKSSIKTEYKTMAYCLQHLPQDDRVFWSEKLCKKITSATDLTNFCCLICSILTPLNGIMLLDKIFKHDEQLNAYLLTPEQKSKIINRYAGYYKIFYKNSTKQRHFFDFYQTLKKEILALLESKEENLKAVFVLMPSDEQKMFTKK